MSHRSPIVPSPPQDNLVGNSQAVSDIWYREERCVHRVLNSATFSRAPRLARLLDYLCDKRFAGEAGELKEYTIAVELLGRPTDFQPKEDASIRVDMNRLRRQLEKYYRAEGEADEIIVSIPAGQYVPLFEAKSGVAASGNETPKSEVIQSPVASKLRRPKFLLLAAGLCLGVLVTLVFQRVPLDSFTFADNRAEEMMPSSGPSSILTGGEIRILAGTREVQHVDKFGAAWRGDTFYKGGLGLTYPGSYDSLPQGDELWRNVREGDFEYNIPLKPGIYELHLYFIEMVYGTANEGGGEGSRSFCVFANNKHILAMFDIVSDAGGSGIPDVKVFTNVSPASDGILHLRFESKKSKAVVSRIEILPGIPGKMRPVRIACREDSYTDSSGITWSADRFFRGGRLAVRTNEGPKGGLYASERIGHFRYTVPVAPGNYAIKLHFLHGYQSVSTVDMFHSGPRLFDVFCNGEALLRDFSVEKAAEGSNHALSKTFRNVKANAQGKVVLDFIPIKNYACLSAVEILPE